MNDVTVIGLGAMGETLARLQLQQGHQVTVWNRTAAKAGARSAQGAQVAASAAEASLPVPSC
ncbi:NAD(P)-binding domain-containing protein [Caldimonas brevitalea]|uniref:Dehydrogenase n=1 Tax=Caldimonas brevitalea TaxID=413882 RepID=A0A0G3BIE9_9BURK|nr:NAD(P)-binding domain-containing protein [Caldimonas brevitalea]AKJ29219.1 dehydrogenase [Caldimonas brevitalea]